MNYRLGLDVGTASVGLVCYELDADNKPIGIPYHAVRIFAEPVQPAKTGGVGEPKKAARRLARQARRQISRRARRLRRIAHLTELIGVSANDSQAKKSRYVHERRARAASERIDLTDLPAVFSHMAKRRGYSGGFRIKGDDKDKGVVETGISSLKSEMAKIGVNTLGQYLLHRFDNKQTLKLKEAGLYADRSLVEAEFEAIWYEQSKHHPILNRTTDNTYGGQSIKDIYRHAIFHQRPLRSPAGMVGQCSLEPSLRRAPQAQPSAQAFRIEKQIADLRWGIGKRSLALDKPQQDVIRTLLTDKAEVTFEQIYKGLKKAGHPKPTSQWLNLARGGRERLTGDKTRAALRRLKLLEAWDTLDGLDQVRIINLLADMGSPEVFDRDNWDVDFTTDRGKPRNLSTEVVGFINKLISTGKFDRLSKMQFDTGRSAYSVKALIGLTEHMRSTDTDEYAAMSTLYPNTLKKKSSALPQLEPHESTGNTVVDVSLRQVRREVNTAIRTLGDRPSAVIVELSRDMALGQQRRDEIIKRMRKNERDRRSAKEAIEAYGQTAGHNQIRRYLLWTEQDQQWCPYCNRTISLGQAINGAEVHYEHILPRALTRKGKQRDYLVLAHSSCNDEKKDRTPWEAWGDGKDPDRWKIVEERAKLFDKKKLYGKARQLLAKDYEGEVLDDAALQDFAERQFHEGSWIAKLAAQWMRTVCPDVSVSRGMLTAHLRRIWKLETVIPEARYAAGLPVTDTDNIEIDPKDFSEHKSFWEGHYSGAKTDRRLEKRVDHRHHLIDAIVIGLSTRGLYQQMARHYKQVTESGERKLRLSVAPPLTTIRNIAGALLRECNLTHRPDLWPAGPFFLENPLSVVDSAKGPRYAQRVTIDSLAADNDRVDKVRKRIEGIVSEKSRKTVSKAFESRIKAGQTPKEALTREILVPPFNTPISRVQVYRSGVPQKGVQVMHHDRNGKSLHKWLVPRNYAWLEFDPGINGTPSCRLVSLQEVVQNNLSTPNHPIRVFRKGDTVIDTKDGGIFICRKFSNTGPALFLTANTETQHDFDKARSSQKRTVSGKNIGRLDLVISV